MQNNPGVQVGTNVYMFGLAYADDIVLLSRNYRVTHGLLEIVNRHAVGLLMNALKPR